ncbi:MAG: ATP-binding protein [bacterium]
MATQKAKHPVLEDLAGDGLQFERYREIVDFLPFYVMLVDSEHHILMANSAVEQATGSLAVDLCGQFCPKVIHGTDAPYPGCPLEEAAATGRSFERVHYDEVNRVWMRSSVYPTELRSRGNRVFLHFAQDITKEQEASLELNRSLDLHRALGELLRRFQRCRTAVEFVSELIDVTLSFSWMELSTRAAGFLVRDGALELAVHRNLNDEHRERCREALSKGCLCSRVATSGAMEVIDFDQLTHAFPEHPTVDRHGHAAVPLKVENRILGVVNFYIDHHKSLNELQRSFLESAAGVTATAIAQLEARKDAIIARTEKAQLERTLLKRVIATQEEERKRVARELHDDFGQALSAVLLEVRRVKEGSPVPRGWHDAIERDVRELIDRTSSMARDLRPPLLDELGLNAALSRHIDRVCARTGLEIDFQYVSPHEAHHRLDPAAEICLYRIAQEALNNVVRHAEAHAVSVLLVVMGPTVILVVEDDGRGFQLEVAWKQQGEDSLGLMGMQERVELLDGQLTIETAPHKGTTVKATIPLVNVNDDTNSTR